MILSNISIQEAIDKGLLLIDPPPEPKRPTRDGPPCPYQTSAVDLRLGDEVAWFKRQLPVQIDLRQGGFSKLFTADTDRVQLTQGTPFPLEPGRFVLAKTLEQINLPLRDNGTCLAARVEGRSSFSRCGLLVHFTAPTIHAGYQGTLTLEMMNFGPYPILLYKHIPICQLIIEQVHGAPFSNPSQFQGQTRPGGASL